MTLIFTTITRDEALDLMRRGAQAKRAEIEESIRDLRSQLHTPKPESEWTPAALKDAILSPAAPKRKPRRKMSAATRKRMAEAQRARWAKVKAT